MIGGAVRFGAMMYYPDHFMANAVNSTWDQDLEDCLSLFETESQSMASGSPGSPGSLLGGGSDTESCASSCGSPSQIQYNTNYQATGPNTQQAQEYCYMNLDCGDFEYETNNNEIKMAASQHFPPNIDISKLEDHNFNIQNLDCHSLLEYSEPRTFGSPEGEQSSMEIHPGFGNHSQIQESPLPAAQPSDCMMATQLQNTRPNSNMSDSSTESLGSESSSLFSSCAMLSGGSRTTFPCRNSPPHGQTQGSLLASRLPPTYDEHLALKVKPEKESFGITPCGSQNGAQTRGTNYWCSEVTSKEEPGKVIYFIWYLTLNINFN